MKKHNTIKHYMLLVTTLFLSLLHVGCNTIDNELEERTTYTVTFETNGGSYIAKSTVKSGTAVERPTDPTKSDNTFAGWYADENLVSTMTSGSFPYTLNTAAGGSYWEQDVNNYNNGYPILIAIDYTNIND